MNTYIILNNREKYGTIYQTDKTRAEVIETLMFDMWDVVQQRDTVEECQNIINEKGYSMVSIGDFQ